jgi:hypothetical protein
MKQRLIQPNIDRLGVISGLILLAYALSGIIEFQPRELSTQLPGIYIEIQLNSQTIISLLAVLLAVTGTDWLLREHPSHEKTDISIHLLIPAITAWIIGVPLQQNILGSFWWIGFVFGGGILMAVLVAEFIVVDTQDPKYQIASISLTLAAYAIFFLLTVMLKSSELRLYLLVPGISLAAFLISLRTFKLNISSSKPIFQAAICTLIISQITIAAFYLPLRPISFGLFLLGPVYGLKVFFTQTGNESQWKKIVIEAVIVIVIFWTLSLLFYGGN